ncbi:MAG: bacteriohemerythrin [Thermoflexaceae bacterium]|nr:bacteriohemerythrin [Thermoflexaceae bacterium]
MFQFTNDCLTGIDSIDKEHEKLFAMINEGIELLEKNEDTAYAAVKGLIVSLKKYAEEHFANEEAYMEQIGDHELARQKKEHEQFRKYVNQYDLENLQKDNAKEKLKTLLIYLSNWLFCHILGSDLMIGHNVGTDEKDAFAFTAKYRTGIEFVDEEHRRLFEIIKETNDLICAELLHDKYDAIVDIINELKEYTVTHFADEEAYMEKISYAGLTAQKAAHKAFVDMLKRINLENVDEHQQQYLYELVDYLLNWLSTHILKMDKKIPVEQ